MALIIDGHNLIGALPDIDLADPEDELRLLERLRLYRAQTGGQPLIVFFDSGDLPAAFPDLSQPGLMVRFSALGQTADDAILEFLQGRAQPGQYAVVTNDQELAFRARMAGASTLGASVFATRLARPRPRVAQPPPGPDPHDPAFADIYTAFIEADKQKKRLASGRPEDVAIWVERLYGDDGEEAQRAARWLGLYGGEAALDYLRDALTHDNSRVRAAALLALGDLGDPAVQPHLCDRLLHDSASMVRQAAAQSLARIGNAGAEDALQSAATSDPKSKVRREAQAALAQVRARRAP